MIALIDGDHHPPAVRAALDAVERERGLAGAVLSGGGEKLPAGPLEALYGRPVEVEPETAIPRLAPRAAAVLDLADEPALPPSRKLRLAALALHLGLGYEAPGLRLTPPAYAPVAFEGPKLAVIGSGKRTGKTAVAGHWAALLRDRDPAIVCMGRGGPAEPEVAEPGTTLDDLLALAAQGRHAASDYLEDAVLAGVRTVGCRRVGGGPAGEPATSNVPAGAALAAALGPGVLILEGSGSCIPPVAVDRTACVVGPGAPEPLSEYRMLRADLVLLRAGAQLPAGLDVLRAAARSAEAAPRALATIRFELRSEPVEPPPPGARVALFTTGARHCEGVEAVVTSTALARRGELAADLDRAAAERCDVYLTELKAAAVELVVTRARAQGARVAFVRNRPVGLDADLDAALLGLHADAR